MAGRGPAPKDASQRQRRNKESQVVATVVIPPVKQPTLLKLHGKVNPANGEPWTSITKTFWKSLADYPLTQNLALPGWIILAQIMISFDLGSRGDMKSANLARLWLKEFAITPEGILRQKIQVAVAETVTQRAQRAVASSSQFSELRPQLTVVTKSEDIEDAEIVEDEDGS